jgi:cytoskeletal protein CcmA (bactofilin family)
MAGVAKWQPAKNPSLPRSGQLHKLGLHFQNDSIGIEFRENMMQTDKDTQRGTFAPLNASGSSGRATSYLGPGMRVKGEITGNEDLKLDSKVEGLVSIGGFRLTVGPTAHIDGDIVAREAMISGAVNGDIRACDRIEIMKSASIVGDLITGKITIEEGAIFKGSVEVGNSNTRIGTDLDTLLNSAKKAGEK